MRTIQQIFDIIIDAGHYHSLMCFGVYDAHIHELITTEEHDFAIAEIRRYLCDLGGNEDYWSGDVRPDLVDALRLAGLAFSFEDRLKIYREWADRPLPLATLQKETTNDSYR